MSLDPLLGPLGYYGGPTPTMPLLPGSPAIDAGDDAACTSVAEGKVQVVYVFQAGQTNQVSATTNLINWVSLGVKVADTNGVTQLEEVDRIQVPQRYYKLETQAGR